MTIRPYFRWFDLWVGVYVDQTNHAVYVGYLPTLGMRITWRTSR